ncbi:DNA adenine methylase [Prevotella sp. oral taxon 299]|uniref:DNA adenine methylase n=1 Tax=Prevotella sp. oral taxon 299 TaxID=652716 RepID=UPI0001C3F827|nr:DNA adenine methylase [Prevotella sp. oral taxon 299]EFC71558.1 hypothetical protein HMPREF0669_00230 [Prevotella sp. oral taxon 299 str. F0039]
MPKIKHMKAPLPFVGQKRNFIKALTPIIERQPDNTIFVDLFGGSGLLSNLVKELKPNARVIYNDFDNYSERLAHIKETEELRHMIGEKLKDVPKCSKVSEELKAEICDLIEDFKAKKGFVDIVTVASWLLFSNRTAGDIDDIRAKRNTFYNSVIKAPLKADGYLEGAERVCKDFQKLIDEFKNVPNVLFICDPPYMLTEKAHYKKTYWGLGKYLNLLKDMTGLNSIYFTSSKSGLLDFYHWWEKNMPQAIKKPYKIISNNVGYFHESREYEDIMMYNV